MKERLSYLNERAWRNRRYQKRKKLKTDAVKFISNLQHKMTDAELSEENLKMKRAAKEEAMYRYRQRKKLKAAVADFINRLQLLNMFVINNIAIFSTVKYAGKLA